MPDLSMTPIAWVMLWITLCIVIALIFAVLKKLFP